MKVSLIETPSIIEFQNFRKYVGMVEAAVKLDVENSLKRQSWSVEQFQQILAIYTEQVCISSRTSVLLLHSLLIKFWNCW